MERVNEYSGIVVATGAVFVAIVIVLVGCARRATTTLQPMDTVPVVSKSPTPGPPKEKPFSLASITIMLASPDASVTNPLPAPAELLVTDPQGHRTGVDPRTGTVYNEIPDATYFVDELIADDGTGMSAPPLKVFYCPTPLDGNYDIQVIGTGSGSYTLDVLNYDELGDPAEGTISGQIEANRVAGYVMDYSSAPAAQVVIRRIIQIDIKPGSCPNPFNAKSKEVLPVAVLGTEDFDARTIDPATIQLTREGYEVGVSPLRWSYEDVATPFEGELCECDELGPDGYVDLTLKFDTQEVKDTLDLDDEDVAGNTIPLLVTGKLKEDAGGTPIAGSDCVWVLKTGKK